MKKTFWFLAALALTAQLHAVETCSKTESRPNGSLPTCIALDAVLTSGASSVLDGYSYRMVGAEIWSAAGSSATVDIECRISSTAPWFPCYTATDPGATYATGAKYVTLARAYQYRANVSAYVSGTISVVFERYNN